MAPSCNARPGVTRTKPRDIQAAMADPARGVSTIVTVYNKEKFLPRVLGAIFGQEGDFPRDYIFIDDGSTDGSFALMEKLCAGRSDVLLIRQRNTGPAKATNAAARHARQPWLKIVDGDDVLAPWCTRLLLDATLGLGTQFSVGGNLLYRDVNHVTFGAPPEAVPVLRDLFTECLRNVPCNLTPTLIGRDRYWEVGGCDERLFTQDFSLLLRLSWRENPAGIPAPVSARPGHPRRLCRSEALAQPPHAERDGDDCHRRADAEMVPEIDDDAVPLCALHDDEVGDRAQDGEIAGERRSHGEGEPRPVGIAEAGDEGLQHQHGRHVADEVRERGGDDCEVERLAEIERAHRALQLGRQQRLLPA